MTMPALVCYRPNAVEQTHALYLLRLVFRREYACETPLLLSAKQASVFLTLSGLDKVLLQHIWLLIVGLAAAAAAKDDDETTDHGVTNALTSLPQFHTCLRFIALAQDGRLVQALAAAAAGRQQPSLITRQEAAAENTSTTADTSRRTPAQVMADCLVASCNDLIPLPHFVGIELPKLQVLQLIHEQVYCYDTIRQQQQQQQLPPTKDDRAAFAKLLKEYSQLGRLRQANTTTSSSHVMLLNKVDDDRTLHTSNVSSNSSRSAAALDDTESEPDFASESHSDHDGLVVAASTAAAAAALCQDEEAPMTTTMDSVSKRWIALDDLKRRPPTAELLAMLVASVWTGLLLLYTWKRRYRSVSLLVPLSGGCLLFMSTMELMGALKRRNMQTKIHAVNFAYIVLVLLSSWPLARSWTIHQLLARCCVQQVAFGLWMPWIVLVLLDHASLGRQAKDKKD